MPKSRPYTFRPIGVVHSPFKEKFGIPRQPGLVPEVRATLKLLPPFDREEALRGLEGFSHLWLVFVFHAVPEGPWKPTVRPPRLGGNERVGVFATRSMFRPNPIGLSVVELEGFGREDGRLVLHLRGADLLDGTPVLDIKPYLPYVDAIPDARGAYAPSAPATLAEIAFTPEAAAACAALEPRHPGLTRLITAVLAQDPRPGYRTEEQGEYGMRLMDVNVRWRAEGEQVTVIGIDDLS
ncbi:MAG: tRNA (N6-threonylcarbamoyladenosine(37)-N6)-methyltransferase TrmO [Thiohalomonadaceae bacterium]